MVLPSAGPTRLEAYQDRNLASRAAGMPHSCVPKPTLGRRPWLKTWRAVAVDPFASLLILVILGNALANLLCNLVLPLAVRTARPAV